MDSEARSEEQEGSAPSAAAQPAAQAYNSAAWADDDEELQAALTASLRTGPHRLSGAVQVLPRNCR